MPAKSGWRARIRRVRAAGPPRKGGGQVRGGVVHRVRDPVAPDHVASDQAGAGVFELLPDIGSCFGIEMGDRRVLGVPDHGGGAGNGLREGVGSIREQFHQVGGLDGAGRRTRRVRGLGVERATGDE